MDVDKLEVRFGAVPPAGQGGALGTNSVLAATAADTDVRWHLLAGWYHVPGGQAHTRVSLHSLSHAGPAGYGNLVDAVSVIGLTCH